MSQTCTTCFDPDCPKTGADMPKCEHYVRLSDVEQPVVTNPPDSSQELRVDCPFHNQCEEIVTRVRRLERAVCDIGRAAKGELL